MAISGNTASQGMSIKLKYLYFISQETSQLGSLVNGCRKRKFTRPVQRLMGTRKCLTLPPLLLVQKEAGSNSGKMVLWEHR